MKRTLIALLALLALGASACHARGITVYLDVPTTAADVITCAPVLDSLGVPVALACDSISVAVTHNGEWEVLGVYSSIGLTVLPVNIDTPTPGNYRVQYKGLGANGEWGCWGDGFDWLEPDSSVAPRPTPIVRVEPN